MDDIDGAAMHAQTQSPFFNCLPPEIRQLIYQCYFSTPSNGIELGTGISIKDIKDRIPAAALLLTCKLAYHEAAHMMSEPPTLFINRNPSTGQESIVLNTFIPLRLIYHLTLRYDCNRRPNTFGEARILLLPSSTPSLKSVTIIVGPNSRAQSKRADASPAELKDGEATDAGDYESGVRILQYLALLSLACRPLTPSEVMTAIARPSSHLPKPTEQLQKLVTTAVKIEIPSNDSRELFEFSLSSLKDMPIWAFSKFVLREEKEQMRLQ